MTIVSRKPSLPYDPIHRRCSGTFGFLCGVDLPLVLALLATIPQGTADVVAEHRAIRAADRTHDDEQVSGRVGHRETRAFLRQGARRVTRGQPCHELDERGEGT